MTRDARFWRNVTIVGLVHLAVLLGLLWWSRSPRPAGRNIVWMEGGAGRNAATSAAGAVETPSPPEEPPLITPNEPAEESTPEILPSAKSEIELPSATPPPTPKPRPTETATPTPKRTPKPTPRPTPKHTPKPKASATPKKKATPKPKSTPEEDDAETAKKKALAKKALAAEEEGAIEGKPKGAKKATAAEKEEGDATGEGGSGGKGQGEGGASEFGWYGSMLQDRYHSEWVQPTSIVHSATLSVLLRVRIQKDGRISEYSITKSSGNPVVDDSVTAAAARVKRVDPLPAGLGDDYYDVNINFELTSGQ